MSLARFLTPHCPNRSSLVLSLRHADDYEPQYFIRRFSSPPCRQDRVGLRSWLTAKWLLFPILRPFQVTYWSRREYRVFKIKRFRPMFSTPLYRNSGAHHHSSAYPNRCPCCTSPKV